MNDGYSELFNGRVKTLHPRILGGLLGDPIKDKSDFIENNMKFSIYCLDENYIPNLHPPQYTLIMRKDKEPNILFKDPLYFNDPKLLRLTTVLLFC